MPAVPPAPLRGLPGPRFAGGCFLRTRASTAPCYELGDDRAPVRAATASATTLQRSPTKRAPPPSSGVLGGAPPLRPRAAAAPRQAHPAAHRPPPTARCAPSSRDRAERRGSFAARRGTSCLPSSARAHQPPARVAASTAVHPSGRSGRRGRIGGPAGSPAAAVRDGTGRPAARQAKAAVEVGRAREAELLERGRGEARVVALVAHDDQHGERGHRAPVARIGCRIAAPFEHVALEPDRLRDDAVGRALRLAGGSR